MSDHNLCFDVKKRPGAMVKYGALRLVKEYGQLAIATDCSYGRTFSS